VVVLGRSADRVCCSLCPGGIQLVSTGTWEYKPPSAFDIPLDLNVLLIPKSPNPEGVLGSKATGEPPYMIANSGALPTMKCI
jgi:xanthine dehydrogenase molybdopterin-binding subunit B